MRRWTLITIIVLLAALTVTGIWQFVLASRDRGRFPGPAPGTPLPAGISPAP